jgi:glycine cleavage system H lipoate-binding protein
MPLDRLYHRGHTWVQQKEDGSWIIGLDDFGRRILGATGSTRLPEVGSIIRVNGTGWTVVKDGVEIRILAPIDGRVVEHGSESKGWYLHVLPLEEKPAVTHLLAGEDVQPWLQRELERLQIALAPRGESASLADGGVLVNDPSRENPRADWDRVYGEIFLEP